MTTVGIIGAGTMGAGIAQVAATAGWNVALMDVDEPTVRAAIDGIVKRLDRLVEKEKITAARREDAAARLHVAGSPEAFSAAALVLEAVVENLDVKKRVLRVVVPAVSADAILATNTSSLSVTALGDAIDQPHRTVGMHFFNPAPLMKLVEVIAGNRTDPAIVDRVAQIAEGWGKKVARAADVPGFIVNHVARPYYLEAFRILEEGCAGPNVIDKTMRELGGFRMGPLELTDLIGQDVNTATTRSVWEGLGKPPVLAPSLLQEGLVAKGHLGRKTGRGVYRYEDGAANAPAVTVGPQPLELSDELREAVDAFASAAGATDGDEIQRYILARILAALIVQATFAHERGVASKADIDIALKCGTNYPKGPFEWLDQIGPDNLRRLVDALEQAGTVARPQP